MTQAVVTGGGAGIGLATARLLKRDGWRVTIADVDPGAGRVAADEGFAFAQCDVTDAAAVASLFDDCKDLSVLVNNAGYSGLTAPLDAQSPEEWQRSLDVNLTATFHSCRVAVPLMRARCGGVIVNIASVAGRIGYENRSPYAAAKWGVLGLTVTLAREVARAGIRVNAILPSAVRGPRIEGVIARYAEHEGITVAEAEAHYLNRNATGRFIEPEEIAETVAFLCSNKAPSITGQIIGVDGGFQ